MNSPCKCDFQCRSDYCQAEKCVNPVTVALSSAKISTKVNEETPVTWSILNSLNKDVDVTIALSTSSGIVMSSAEAGQCSGNQCSISARLKPKEQRAIRISALCQDSISVPILATLAYTIDNKTHELEKQSIQVQCFSCPQDTFITTYRVENNNCVQKVREIFVLIVVVAVLVIAGVFLLRMKKEEGGVSKKLEELKVMADKGLITGEEFEQKKKDLLTKL